MKPICIVALATVMICISGCGPSEREVATEKLLSVEYSDRMADYIRVLISEGADVNARSRSGWTPLMYAASNSNLEIVQLLLEKGADVNARNTAGWTPLLHAAQFSSSEIVELLIEKGADVNARGTLGMTPLSVCSHDAVKQLLKAAGAKE